MVKEGDAHPGFSLCWDLLYDHGTMWLRKTKEQNRGIIIKIIIFLHNYNTLI